MITTKQIQEAIEAVVRRHGIATNELTETQMAEVIKQAIASGDLMRHVRIDTNAQAVSYIPYRELTEVQAKYNELLMAVEDCYPGETRHQTALRILSYRHHGEASMDEKLCSSSSASTGRT